MIVDLERSWVRQAKCIGTKPDLFFYDHGASNFRDPNPKVQAAWDLAKEVCRTCPVVRECARDSLGEIEGVWGGLDPAERVRLRRANSNRVRKMEPDDPRRQEYVELIGKLRDTPMHWQEVARLTGLSQSAVQELYETHLEQIDPRQEAVGIEHSPAAALPEGTLRKIIKLRTEGVSLADIGRQTGVSARTVRRHLDLHAPELAALKAMGSWPPGAPKEGDGWVRHEGHVRRAYYVAETTDSTWYLMRMSLALSDTSTSWFRAEDVRIMRNIPKVRRRRTGKVSRVYGTAISSTAKERAAG